MQSLVSNEVYIWSQGLLIGASLIIAVGAQNAFLLGLALRRHHHWLAASICISCDFVLILAGIFGAALLINQFSWLSSLSYWGGIVFLTGYGLLSLQRSFKSNTLNRSSIANKSRKAVLLTTLAVTLLNPHVYLDVVVLLGSIGNQYENDMRHWFAFGAITASTLWFAGLTFGARWLEPVFQNPKAWKILDLVIAIVMFSIALNLYKSGLPSNSTI